MDRQDHMGALFIAHLRNPDSAFIAAKQFNKDAGAKNPNRYHRATFV